MQVYVQFTENFVKLILEELRMLFDSTIVSKQLNFSIHKYLSQDDI